MLISSSGGTTSGTSGGYVAERVVQDGGREAVVLGGDAGRADGGGQEAVGGTERDDGSSEDRGGNLGRGGSVDGATADVSVADWEL